jgi:hypothetical protein
MDNDWPHVAVHTRDFLNNNDINHFKSPAQSPDLNPIEIVRHDLKVFLGEEVKPKNNLLMHMESILILKNNS